MSRLVLAATSPCTALQSAGSPVRLVIELGDTPFTSISFYHEAKTNVQAKTLSALALAAGQLRAAGQQLLSKLKKPKGKAKARSADGKVSKVQQPSQPRLTRTAATGQADAGGKAAKKSKQTSQAALTSKKSNNPPQPVRLTRSSIK